jgi:hypothetical protein
VEVLGVPREGVGDVFEVRQARERAVGLALGLRDGESLTRFSGLVWEHVVGTLECGFVVHTGKNRF